jgi:5-methylcytosine-specific restriction endonuclease McrA
VVRRIWRVDRTLLGGAKTEEEEMVLLREMWSSKRISRYIVYELYLVSKRWKRLRTLVLDRDGCCLKCGSVAGLQVHHKVSPYIGDLGVETFDGLVTLCYVCHANVTKKWDLLADSFWGEREVVPRKNLFELLRRGSE